MSKVFHMGNMFSRLTITAVEHVSCHVGAGEIFGLAGESGCGKSTLARMILGFEEPIGGDDHPPREGRAADHRQAGLAHGGGAGGLPEPVRDLQPLAAGGTLFLRGGPTTIGSPAARRRPWHGSTGRCRRLA